jgi:hypothetical protein
MSDDEHDEDLEIGHDGANKVAKKKKKKKRTKKPDDGASVVDGKVTNIPCRRLGSSLDATSRLLVTDPVTFCAGTVQAANKQGGPGVAEAPERCRCAMG